MLGALTMAITTFVPMTLSQLMLTKSREENFVASTIKGVHQVLKMLKMELPKSFTWGEQNKGAA